jgi:hypothetical protein
MKTYSTSCGDWHLGWGLGGKNKLGKLILNDDDTYLWKGHSQDRHGQKSNLGAYLHFRLVNLEIEVIDSKGYSPLKQEILSAVDRVQMIKKQAIYDAKMKRERTLKLDKVNKLLTQLTKMKF